MGNVTLMGGEGEGGVIILNAHSVWHTNAQAALAEIFLGSDQLYNQSVSSFPHLGRSPPLPFLLILLFSGLSHLQVFSTLLEYNMQDIYNIEG